MKCVALKLTFFEDFEFFFVFEVINVESSVQFDECF
jgi:hypothetical protein